MALPGQPIDPTIAAELYGAPVPVPEPAPAPEPWSWVPDGWRAAPAEPVPPPIVPVSDELPGLPAPAPSGFPSPMDGLAGGPVPPDLAPPMPEPDAISGAAPIAPAARVADLQGFDVSTETPAPPPPPGIDLAADDPFVRLTDAQAYSAVEQADPATLARLEVDRERRRQIAASAALLKADEDNLEAIKQNVEARRIADDKTQAELDQITADATALSKRPLDRGRWFRDLSVGGKIAAAIGAIVGGLMSKPGGPNYGVDFITKHIDDDIADQKYDIENARTGLEQRRGAVAQEFARHGNLFQAVETVRQASYQSVIRRMETEQQNFDPRGSSFLEYGKRIAEMRGKAAASQEAMRRQRFDENHKTAQYDLEVAKFRSQQQRDAQAAAARAAGASAARAENQVLEPRVLAAMNPSVPVAPPYAMTVKQYDSWVRTQKVGEEFAKAKEDAKSAQRANTPEERNRELAVPGVVDDEGNLVPFRNQAVAQQLAIDKGNADDMVRMADELVTMIRKNGHEANFIKSPEWLRAQQTFTALLMRSKEQNKLGALSESDIDLTLKMIGTNDPTQIRDTTAGLQQFRHNTIESLNTMMRSQAVLPKGRKLARWEPPSLVAPEAKESPEQARLRSVIKKSTETLDEVAREEIRKRRADLSPEELRDPDVYYRTAREGAAAARAVFDPEVSTKQRAAIEELELVARGPADDPAAVRAREDLESIAKDGDSTKLRRLASAALTRSAAPPESPAVDEPIREIARETVPPERK